MSEPLRDEGEEPMATDTVTDAPVEKSKGGRIKKRLSRWLFPEAVEAGEAAARAERAETRASEAEERASKAEERASSAEERAGRAERAASEAARSAEAGKEKSGKKAADEKDPDYYTLKIPKKFGKSKKEINPRIAAAAVIALWTAVSIGAGAKFFGSGMSTDQHNTAMRALKAQEGKKIESLQQQLQQATTYQVRELSDGEGTEVKRAVKATDGYVMLYRKPNGGDIRFMAPAEYIRGLSDQEIVESLSNLRTHMDFTGQVKRFDGMEHGSLVNGITFSISAAAAGEDRNIPALANVIRKAANSTRSDLVLSTPERITIRVDVRDGKAVAEFDALGVEGHTLDDSKGFIADIEPATETPDASL